MELRAVIALMVFFGGLWTYMLRVIILRSSQTPTDFSVFFLSIAHFVNFVYVCGLFLIFFGLGCEQLKGREHRPRPPTRVESLFFTTWHVAAAFLLVYYALIRAVAAGLQSPLGLSYVVVVALPAVITYTHYRVSRRIGIRPVLGSPHVAAVRATVLTAIAFTGYLLIMAMVCSDVRILSDRQYYRAGDTVYVTATASGYVLLPSLVVATLGTEVIIWTGHHSYKVAVPPFALPHQPQDQFIQVQYVADFPKLRFKKVEYLAVAYE